MFSMVFLPTVVDQGFAANWVSDRVSLARIILPAIADESPF